MLIPHHTSLNISRKNTHTCTTLFKFSLFSINFQFLTTDHGRNWWPDYNSWPTSDGRCCNAVSPLSPASPGCVPWAGRLAKGHWSHWGQHDRSRILASCCWWDKDRRTGQNKWRRSWKDNYSDPSQHSQALSWCSAPNFQLLTPVWDQRDLNTVVRIFPTIIIKACCRVPS